ncbi:MAG TPA: 30S ribosome-binding factor RbfA [Anaerolineae bacterium]|nr:30S ribosome-binding factor RbfA [Anaerolineae bacterium]HQH37654.1 30S ribosome-binding factor RbfA [Anaerolineae bacterium]
MSKKYLGRVNQMLRRKITQLLLEESNDPRLADVTITDVVVNRDTTRAEVFYSIIGSADEIAATQTVLDGAAGWLRNEMAPTLRLRNVPRLVFTYDPSLAHGARIEELLQQQWPEHSAEGHHIAEDLADDLTDDDSSD